MFFIASKLFGFFAIPSNLIACIGILGLLLMATRFARAGRRLALAALIALALIGFSPIGNLLIMPLEQRFATAQADAGKPPPAGVVVLGGAISLHVSAGRDEVALNEAAERMTAAVALARRYRQARILFSGGDSSLLMDEGVEAQFAIRLFAGLGIGPERVLLEERSRSTAENARYAKALAQPEPGQRWLLVTSAYHMPRAVGAFRRAGFAVEPYPVDWRTAGPHDALRPFPTLGEGLRRTDTAVREWVGLAMYWMTGKSTELFPGP